MPDHAIIFLRITSHKFNITAHLLMLYVNLVSILCYTLFVRQIIKRKKLPWTKFSSSIWAFLSCLFNLIFAQPLHPLSKIFFGQKHFKQIFRVCRIFVKSNIKYCIKVVWAIYWLTLVTPRSNTFIYLKQYSYQIFVRSNIPPFRYPDV